MSRRMRNLDEVMADILSSDEESVLGDEYDSGSDFESESDGDNDNVSVASSDPSSDNDIPVVVPVPRGRARVRGAGVRVRGGRARGRGVGRGRAPYVRPPSPPGWTADTTGFNERVFDPDHAPGPRNIPNTINIESTPIDYFSLYWDEEIWDMMLTETNRRAQQVHATHPNKFYAKNLVDKPLTLPELKAFFGLRITMEMLVYKDRYEQYWRSKDTFLAHTPAFGKVMPKHRFISIWSLLHCVNEEDPGLDKQDKIYKTRPILDHILPKFRHYFVPDCELSLDEGMIPTKNKLSFKQYIKDKPTKWGIKSFLLTDSKHGYICDAEVYTGRRPDAEAIDGLGVTGNLVVRLIQNYTDQNYAVYTDRFYSTVQLAEYLLEHHGVRLCGTAMTNRREFPRALIHKNNVLPRGHFELLFNGNVATIVWQDKKPIYFVTSIYISSPPENVLRYNATEHRRIPVPCPKPVKAYNSYMGGTDKNDQMTKLQKCRRHYKWPRRLVMKFFMWVAYNAYVQMGYVKPHDVPGKRTYTFHFFIEALCEELAKDVRTTENERGNRRSQETQNLRRLKTDQNHGVEKSADGSTNHRCVVCCEKYKREKAAHPRTPEKNLPKRCKTVFRCTFCEEYLCIGKPDKNCWFDWHNKAQYWR